MYIIATSLDELESRFEIATREAEKHSVTWSISKFFAGININIVSGHQVSGPIREEPSPDWSRPK